MGTWLGYTSFVILTIFALISTFLKYPVIQEIIRILGTFFLLYLAYKISFSSSAKEDKKVNPVTFIDTFIFQFLNPKGVMAGINFSFKICNRRRLYK